MIAGLRQLSGGKPSGVTTQDPLRQKSLGVGDKTQRAYNFHEMTLDALNELVQAAGLRHPHKEVGVLQSLNVHVCILIGYVSICRHKLIKKK